MTSIPGPRSQALQARKTNAVSAGVGVTLINQRAEEVNKAVLELCDNLFLHRTKGKNSLASLTKWLDLGAVKDTGVVIDSLSTLPTGECWAWLREGSVP